MAQSTLPLAGRYAKALFGLALQENALKDVERDLGKVNTWYKASGDFRKFIHNPVLSLKKRKDILEAALIPSGAHYLTLQACKVIVHNRRLAILKDIIDAFMARLRAYRQEVSVKVTTAVPLSDSHLGQIKENLEQVLQKKVIVETKVREDILGGVIVTVGSKMLDNSIAGKLQRLQVPHLGEAKIVRKKTGV